MEPKYSNLVNFMNGEATYTIFAQTSLSGPLHMMQLQRQCLAHSSLKFNAEVTTVVNQTHDNDLSQIIFWGA